MSITLLLCLLAALTFLSAFFSGSEIALFSLSSPKVKAFAADANPRKRLVARLLKHPRDLLVTVFFYNTVVNILLQNTASTLFGEFSSWAFRVGVPLLLTLIAGEVIPKNIALQSNVTISYIVAPIINFLQTASYPLMKVISKVTTILSRSMFFFFKEEKNISKEELQHALKTSLKEGILTPDEAMLANGYLNLRNAQVKELMRPREEILFYDIKEPLKKLTYLFVDQECTRIPVCEDNFQNVLGIINARDFFTNRSEIQQPQDLQSLLTKPFYIPESALAKSLLKRFEEQSNEIGLIVDEYGSISGLITVEDVVEEVIGEITDRRDIKKQYTRSGDNVIIASGKLELSEFEEIFGLPLNSKNSMVTLGGWLTEEVGDIPKSGFTHKTPSFLFHVLAADPNRVRRVYIRKLEGAKGGNT